MKKMVTWPRTSQVDDRPHNIYTVQTGTMLKILNLVQSDLLEVDTGNVALFGTDPLKMLDAMIDGIMHIHLELFL